MKTQCRLPAVALVVLGLGVVWASRASGQFAPEPGKPKAALPPGAVGQFHPAPAGSVLNMRRPQAPAVGRTPPAQPAPPAQASPPSQPTPPAQPTPQRQRYQPYSYGNSPYYHRPWSYGNPPYYQRPPVTYYPYFYVPRDYGSYSAYPYYEYPPYRYPLYYPPLMYNWTPFGYQRVY